MYREGLLGKALPVGEDWRLRGWEVVPGMGLRAVRLPYYADCSMYRPSPRPSPLGPPSDSPSPSTSPSPAPSPAPAPTQETASSVDSSIIPLSLFQQTASFLPIHNPTLPVITSAHSTSASQVTSTSIAHFVINDTYFSNQAVHSGEKQNVLPPEVFALFDESYVDPNADIVEEMKGQSNIIKRPGVPKPEPAHLHYSPLPPFSLVLLLLHLRLVPYQLPVLRLFLLLLLFLSPVLLLLLSLPMLVMWCLHSQYPCFTFRTPPPSQDIPSRLCCLHHHLHFQLHLPHPHPDQLPCLFLLRLFLTTTTTLQSSREHSSPLLCYPNTRKPWRK